MGGVVVDVLGLLLAIVVAFAGATVPRAALVVAVWLLLEGGEQYKGYVLVGIIAGLAARDMLDEQKQREKS